MTPSRKRLISGLFLLRRGFLNGPRKTLTKKCIYSSFCSTCFSSTSKVLVLTRHMLFCFLLLTNNYRLFNIHFCYTRDLASFKLFAAWFQVLVPNQLFVVCRCKWKGCRVILSRNCFRQSSFQWRHYILGKLMQSTSYCHCMNSIGTSWLLVISISSCWWGCCRRVLWFAKTNVLVRKLVMY